MIDRPAPPQNTLSAPTERLDLVIPERRILARVGALARQVSEDYRGKSLSLIVMLKNALIFAADLARRIELPITMDFVAASSYGEATRSAGRVTLGGIDKLDLRGRHALVIEDILDTGLTVATVFDHLRQREPASLAFCTLLRKPTCRGLDLPVPYVGFDIPNEFVVGYGMDYAERYRGLRGVYRLTFEAANT